MKTFAPYRLICLPTEYRFYPTALMGPVVRTFVMCFRRDSYQLNFLSLYALERHSVAFLFQQTTPPYTGGGAGWRWGIRVNSGVANQTSVHNIIIQQVHHRKKCDRFSGWGVEHNYESHPECNRGGGKVKPKYKQYSRQLANSIMSPNCAKLGDRANRVIAQFSCLAMNFFFIETALQGRAVRV